MNNKEIIQRINAVCNTLDNGIIIKGIQNAANLAGCYSVLQEILTALESDKTIKNSDNESK